MENEPPPVAEGELRGKVQGTFFLLGLCVSCDSANLQRELFIILTITACVCGPDRVDVLREC